jgi:exosortase J
MITELPASTTVVAGDSSPSLPWRGAILLACVCAIGGVFAFWGTARWLLGVWRTDDLKSMGLVVPFISFGLILRAWRAIGWATEGSWWGFAVLGAAALAVFLRDQTMLVLTVHKGWLVQLPPVPLLAVLYALGMVLLFGGTRLLRAAWFPVLFMVAVLPVPETFSRVVDLPLQHASATVARGFAHLLGEKLTPDNLRLMFTPDFGMFIAPGCNGIRGAVTLGMAAVVIAYVYRFRWTLFAPVVFGAVLLGYLFNFVRLCLLVVYYKIALPYPWLQDRAKGADYILGGCLFVLALYLFFAVADRLRRKPGEVVPAPAIVPVEPQRPAVPLWLKAAAVAGLALVFGLDDLHAQREAGVQNLVIPAMPNALGGWRLARSYQDTLTTGVVVYQWGDYQSPNGAETVSVGVSPELDMHDVEVCHLARGEDPVWHGQVTAQTVSGAVAFVAATYNNGQVQMLEASTLCDAGGCREYTNKTDNMTFVYAHPRRVLPMATDAGRPVPMLLKVTSPDVAARPEAAEQQMAAELQSFLRGADLGSLAARFRSAGRAK